MIFHGKISISFTYYVKPSKDRDTKSRNGCKTMFMECFNTIQKHFWISLRQSRYSPETFLRDFVSESVLKKIIVFAMVKLQQQTCVNCDVSCVPIAARPNYSPPRVSAVHSVWSDSTST